MRHLFVVGLPDLRRNLWSVSGIAHSREELLASRTHPLFLWRLLKFSSLSTHPIIKTSIEWLVS
jgi:hypothetical protein